ncbi:MAG: EAL domain-containing protein [Pseudomonadota bacterium]|nr:EAL domain-containing protein [Pseudomonadota bacterium]
MNSSNKRFPKRILIVEDEKITALDLKLTLEDLGYDVVASVSSGEAAVEQAEALTPDLIMMDIHLDTEMLGTEAARIIAGKYAIPIIFLSAYSDDKTLDEATASLPYGYMVKPFEKREIEAAIRMAITRHHADLEIRKSEERLRLALNAARMRIWEWEPGSSDMPEPPALNVRAPRLIAHSLDELLSRVHPDDQDKIREKIGTDSDFQQVVRYREDDDGEYRKVEIFASLFRWSDGERRVIGVVHDIHERFMEQEKLRQASAVFDATSEGILITDSERRVLSVNPAFSDITGYAADEVMGLMPDDFLHARRYRDHFYPRLISEPDKHWSGEISCRRKNGDMFPAWEHVCSIQDDNGEITNYVITFSDISDLRRVESSLEKLAFSDSLTGVGNRVHLERVMQKTLEENSQHNRQLGILYLDLDGFKLVNDTLGHSEGDELLKVMAERFRQSVREEDTVARIGGDEFVILIPEVEQESGLEVIAEKLLDAVKKPVRLSREAVEVSASIGIVISKPSIKHYEALLKAADTALFEAKRQGKNRYCIYDFNLAMEFNERLRIERHLKQAVRENELALAYQPLVDLDTGRVIGGEALCRWYSPDLGAVPPDRFIPIAEQSDVIIEIGQWVLTESLHELQRWTEAGYPDLFVSVNVSVRQLTDSHFMDFLSSLLNGLAIDPGRLELEITETALQENEQMIRQLLDIRELGVKLAIDDFGTGYSSLSRLKELPFDRLKIDRSFIRDLPDDSSDVEICRAVMALCKVLQLDVTAEGIETPDQLALLRGLGCHCGQGYLFSRPLTSARFREWLSSESG